MGYQGSTVHIPKPKKPRGVCGKDLMGLMLVVSALAWTSLTIVCRRSS